MNIADEIERFLLTELAVDLNKESLAPDEDLLLQGIIDSMGIMKLSVFLENTFGIRVIDEDIIPENFQNLDSLRRFVEQKA